MLPVWNTEKNLLGQLLIYNLLIDSGKLRTSHKYFTIKAQKMKQDFLNPSPCFNWVNYLYLCIWKWSRKKKVDSERYQKAKSFEKVWRLKIMACFTLLAKCVTYLHLLVFINFYFEPGHMKKLYRYNKVSQLGTA